MAADKTEVDGIAVHVDASTLDDFEITEALVDMASQGDDFRQVSAIVRLFALIFGNDAKRVKGELRSAHGGKLTNETAVTFLLHAIEAAGAKN